MSLLVNNSAQPYLKVQSFRWTLWIADAHSVQQSCRLRELCPYIKKEIRQVNFCSGPYMHISVHASFSKCEHRARIIALWLWLWQPFWKELSWVAELNWAAKLNWAAVLTGNWRYSLLLNRRKGPRGTGSNMLPRTLAKKAFVPEGLNPYVSMVHRLLDNLESQNETLQSRFMGLPSLPPHWATSYSPLHCTNLVL